MHKFSSRIRSTVRPVKFCKVAPGTFGHTIPSSRECSVTEPVSKPVASTAAADEENAHAGEANELALEAIQAFLGEIQTKYAQSENSENVFPHDVGALLLLEKTQSEQHREVDQALSKLGAIQRHLESLQIESSKTRASQQLLYDHMWMAHEDRETTLHIAIEQSVEVNKALKKEVEETELLVRTLEQDKKDKQMEMETLATQIQQLNFEKHLTNYNAMASFYLVNQIHQAIQELDQYSKRVTLVRALNESQRRSFHNQLQELRGNLRVYCRIRPLTEAEQNCQRADISVYPNEHRVRLPASAVDTQTRLWKSPADKNVHDISFIFDHVFDVDATQADIFNETSNLIQSALDGFNVCLFAYGQTGSGKTYTMDGSSTLKHPGVIDHQSGLIPRAVELIFKTMESLNSKGWVYKLEVSIFEIYNETVRDLIGFPEPLQRPKKDGGTTSRGRPEASQQPEVKLDASGKVMVTNLNSVHVRKAAEVFELLCCAQRQRVMASTACNDHSSRSHSVFQLRIIGNRHCDGKIVRSSLFLVDLAGSERLEKVQSTGERLKETQHINKSLSCLCDVIYAIASRKKHVPFRNSKLTMILKDSLGGKSKTLMFVNISSLKSNLNETLNSLRFASKANACNLT